MGILFSAADFERNDDIRGQGKEVLLFCKSVHVTKYELGRIFHAFNITRRPGSVAINLADMFKAFRIKYSLFASIFFQLYDIHKTGEVQFCEYLTTLWALLTSDDDCLAVLCFNMLDVRHEDTLEFEEVLYLCQIIWEFKPSKAVQRAIQKLRQNRDGTVTLPEFVLLCKHHSSLLAPIRDLRKKLRAKIVFSRFWQHMSKKRNAAFDYPSSAIRLINRKKENYLQYSMDYLNLRYDAVPREYIEQYKLVQRKKAASSKGHVDWPYEVIEQYRTLTQPPHIPGPEEQDGYEAKSTSGEQHSVMFSVDIPDVLQSVLQGKKAPERSMIYSPTQQQEADMHYII